MEVEEPEADLERFQKRPTVSGEAVTLAVDSDAENSGVNHSNLKMVNEP